MNGISYPSAPGGNGVKCSIRGRVSLCAFGGGCKDRRDRGNPVRRLGVAAVLFIAISTPNVIDAGVARRQFCEDYFGEVFLAARHAVDNVGARIIHADDLSGSIVGRLEAELYGHEIEINVWINRDRDSRGGVEPMWVQVNSKVSKNEG